MTFANRISQVLHDEHRATIALIERLEQLATRHRRGGGPDCNDRAVTQLLSDLAIGISGEVERHFAFEENHLFSYLAANGDVAIGAHLTDEHNAIRPLGQRVATLARAAAGRGFDEAGWDEFRRLGLELCERMLAHIQKEEMALLPLIDESMDAETEARLHHDYAESV
jgi:hemerythrin-like domain-containing protein